MSALRFREGGQSQNQVMKLVFKDKNIELL